VLGHVVQANRLRTVDQQTQDSAAARRRSDRRARCLVDTHGQELRQAAALLVQDTERRVARARQLARGSEDLIQHDRQIDARRQGPPDLEKPPAALDIAAIGSFGRAHGHA